MNIKDMIYTGIAYLLMAIFYIPSWLFIKWMKVSGMWSARKMEK